MMVAGERSGDVYGARLARALTERLREIEIFGCGGEAMRHAGVETTVDARQFAMVVATASWSRSWRVMRGSSPHHSRPGREGPPLR